MTELSNERLVEMLAGLEGVTPGPRHMYVSPNDILVTDDAGNNMAHFLPMEDDAKADFCNATQFARCDPDTMRSILTELLSLRQSHSTGVAVNAALVERFQSAYRAAGQKRNWHPTWPDAEASFEILSALYTHPKEAEVTVTEEDVEHHMPEPDFYSDGFQILAKPFNHNGFEARSLFTEQTVRAALVAALSRKG